MSSRVRGVASLALAGLIAAAAPAAAQGLRLFDASRNPGVTAEFASPVLALGGPVETPARDGRSSFIDILLAPQPRLGISVNQFGDTNQITAGLGWNITLLQGIFGSRDSFYLDATLGGTTATGRPLDAEDPSQRAGSRILLRESLELGYSFTPSQSLSVILDRASTPSLADRTAPPDNVGIRWGLRF